MTDCGCNNHHHKEPLIPKTYVLDTIEEMGKELEEVVSDYLVQEKKDSLQLIFQKQQQLLDHLNKSKPENYYGAQERFKGSRMFDLLVALEDEGSELRRALPWKWWKDYNSTEYDDKDQSNEDDSYTEFLTPEDKATQQQLIDNTLQEYIQKEVIDLWHFLIQLSIEAGLDSKKVVDMYLDKNEENHGRQDRGY